MTLESSYLLQFGHLILHCFLATKTESETIQYRGLSVFICLQTMGNLAYSGLNAEHLFLSRKSEVAASLDSIAALCQDPHLCKTLGLFLRLLPTMSRVFAALPEATFRFKA